MQIQYSPIGVIRTPFEQPEGVPIQPTAAADVRGSVEINPQYLDGLKDLDGYSHIILIYHFHQSRKHSLLVVPFLDSTRRGLFSTRAPNRPNPIGISIVRLLKVNNNILEIEGVDMLNNTPLLDIKPFIPALNPSEGVRTGWAQKNLSSFRWKQADRRFSEETADQTTKNNSDPSG